MDRDKIEAFLVAVLREPANAEAMLHAEPALLHNRVHFGETPLHYLAIEGYTEAVRFLVEHGADVNAQDEFGDTALVRVAMMGKLDMALVLLAHGANPNAPSDTLDNVLHAAVGSGCAELVEALLSAGARADYITELGETVRDAVRGTPEQRSRMEAVLRKHGL